MLSPDALWDPRLKAEGDDKNWRRRRCDCCGRLCKTRMSGEKGGTMSEDSRKQASASKRDKPWLIRTYAGHSTAEASNALYRKNLARGQTGLSVAFDLPTQTGYDCDHPLAKGEVGKVGVPISHLGDMEKLFAGIPLAQMNTSMTINATAPWLLALYIACAEKQGASRRELTGKVQNALVRSALSRGTYIFPPQPSLRLTPDVLPFPSPPVPPGNPTKLRPH